MKKYNVILADPPWQFEVWNKDTGQGRSAESHYPTMKIEDICNLPIKEMSAENCALFMWAVWPSLLDYPQQVLEAWGFKYKTLGFIWVKAKRSGFGFFTGMGYYARANSEPCLLAIKGSMPVSNHDVLSILYAPIKEHSRKPTEQYNKIERLYPPDSHNYLELFARRKTRPGWDYWGNEVESDIELKGLP